MFKLLVIEGPERRLHRRRSGTGLYEQAARRGSLDPVCPGTEASGGAGIFIRVKVIAGFRDFISRGNVVDLAVAVVVGAAFTALVTSLVENLLTPVIAAVIGQPDFSDLTFTINGSVFRYGSFLNALIAFLSISAAVYFFVVVPLNALAERRAAGEQATHRDCPECLSEVPIAATRCAHCTVELKPTA
jgi:large conductance mechanosensitive channel